MADTFNQAMALHQKDHLEQAKVLYETFLKTTPGHPDALHLLGVLHGQMGNLRQGAELIAQALTLRPDNVEGHFNLGKIMLSLGRLTEAAASFGQATILRPDWAEAYFHQGLACMQRGQLIDAANSFGRAAALRPEWAEAHFNQGTVLQQMGRLVAALECYGKGLLFQPNAVAAYLNQGHILAEMDNLLPALDSYEKAMALDSEYEYLLDALLFTKIKVCDWQDIDTYISKLLSTSKSIPCQPFHILPLIDSLSVHYKSSTHLSQKSYPENNTLGFFKKKIRSEKIHIGYYSSDFHPHATMLLMSDMFKKHNRGKFKITGFSFDTSPDDAMRKRLVSGFDTFYDVHRKSDLEIAALSRSINIDIAVDLKGFTQASRTGIFAFRAAPIQVNYLGYPGTMGAPFMDYIIADQVIIPEQSRHYYTEKIVYLPHSYQVNDRKHDIQGPIFSRQALGLPEAGFVFCCFNNLYKIMPRVFDVWTKILKNVPGSVLWLLETNPVAATNLRKEAAARGLNPSRLVFAPKVAMGEHLARHRCADLFLDTRPYNAHTTGSDALWAGLPVLTLPGESFASRVAASLLSAVGLPEMITKSEDEYATLAIRLATHADELQTIKVKLAANRLTTPLFDARLFTRHLENAYTQMYERSMADLPPAHIFVPNTPATHVF